MAQAMLGWILRLKTFFWMLEWHHPVKALPWIALYAHQLKTWRHELEQKRSGAPSHECLCCCRKQRNVLTRCQPAPSVPADDEPLPCKISERKTQEGLPGYSKFKTINLKHRSEKLFNLNQQNSSFLELQLSTSKKFLSEILKLLSINCVQFLGIWMQKSLSTKTSPRHWCSTRRSAESSTTCGGSRHHHRSPSSGPSDSRSPQLSRQCDRGKAGKTPPAQIQRPPRLRSCRSGAVRRKIEGSGRRCESPCPIHAPSKGEVRGKDKEFLVANEDNSHILWMTGKTKKACLYFAPIYRCIANNSSLDISITVT